MQNLTSDFSDNRKTPRRLKGLFVLGLGALAIAGVIAGGFWLFSSGITGEGGGDNQASGGGKLPSEWLVKYFGTDDLDDASIGGLSGDPDEDLLYNFQEFIFNTDPTNPDTDGDGQYDGVEVAVNSNPNGEGKLFITDRAREFAEDFVRSNQLDEFTEESITQTLGQLLTSAQAEEVEVPLPDVKLLNVSSDDSISAAISYVQDANGVSSALGDFTENLDTLLQNPNVQELQIAIGSVYEAKDKLQALPVPVPFVTLHQLQLAAFDAAAKVLELSSSVRPELELAQQSELSQNLSYQLQVLENANNLMEGEIVRLNERYPEAFSELN